MRSGPTELHPDNYFQRTLALYQKPCQTFLLKRKDSNLQRTMAAVLPETKFALLLIYIACKHFCLLQPCLPFHHTSIFRAHGWIRTNGALSHWVLQTHGFDHSPTCAFYKPLQESNLCFRASRPYASLTARRKDLLAGGEGFEPSTTVLETAMLPLHQPPISEPHLHGAFFKEHCEYTNYF